MDARRMALPLLCVAILAAGCGGEKIVEPWADGMELTGRVTAAPGEGDVAGVRMILRAEETVPASSPRARAARLVARLGGGASLPGTDAFTASVVTGSADTTVTTGDGRFLFTGLEPGTYTLYAESVSSLAAVRPGIEVPAGGVVDIGDIPLQAVGTITGSVRLAGVSDYSGVLVYVAGTSHAAYSDASGHFTLPRVPAGTHTLVAYRVGFVSVERGGIVVTRYGETSAGLFDLAEGPGLVRTAFSGQVELPQGTAGSGLPVIAVFLDGDGAAVGQLGSAVTGEGGTFAILHPGEFTPSTSIALMAFTAEGDFVSFAVASSGVVVGPVSTGVFDAVELIVETPGGRSVFDYTPSEVTDATALARAALEAAGTSLGDRDAVRDRVIADAGGAIADASGGGYTVARSIGAVVADPPDLRTTIAPGPTPRFTLVDGGGETWDVAATGEIHNGSGDAYDGMFRLEVAATAFPLLGWGTAATQLEDGREVVLGPVPGLGGLTVTRKIFVSASGSFARFAEILANEGVADVTVDVRISGNLGSDEGTDLVFESSDGDAVVEVGDRWLAQNFDAADPALGFFFPGAVPAKNADDLEYTWPDVTVPSGGTVVLFHWALQRSDHDLAALAGELSAIDDVIPADYWEGLTVDEALSGFFIGGDGNVVGGAGAVAPFAACTVENRTRGRIIAFTAASDGSFLASLNQTRSGDEVHVTASDGTDETVIVP